MRACLKNKIKGNEKTSFKTLPCQALLMFCGHTVCLSLSIVFQWFLDCPGLRLDGTVCSHPPVSFEVLTFCVGICLCFQLTDLFPFGRDVTFLFCGWNLKVYVCLEMKSFSLKNVKVCASTSSEHLRQPCSLGQGRRKVKLLEERSIGNGEYFWTSKDTLWEYMQTLTGKQSAATNSAWLLRHWETDYSPAHAEEAKQE